ncbi:hypothetical protein B9479_005805 [Cryptococcus floricola]|uniref:SWR1-complex protein 5 n=1 Tax=Cryptococcus floricola TaxID=2591691 RepID=A0A5D3AUR5_9TREE|nr:hypothetical protein B9479_005805 [Cryptococcus floricola]
MSTLATADLSSDEEDVDFVPAAPKTKRPRKTKGKTKKAKSSGSASDSSSCSSSDGESGDEEDGDEEERIAKKAKIEEKEKDEAEERRRKAREEFEKMKAEAAGPAEVRQAEEEMVEIKRPRRFAGETIFETVKLRASDPEAIAYFEKLKNGDEKPVLPAEESVTKPETPLAETSASPVPAAPQAPKPKGPPRRKRQTLEQMSAALDKGKKMTTLEKSQMDWKSHTSSSTKMEDELAANRRSGGYLANRDFLDRVGERKSETYDQQGTRKR